MPDRSDHTAQSAAALHIALVVAMERLGLSTLEVTEADYRRATAQYDDLRVSFDGDVYRVERANYRG